MRHDCGKASQYRVGETHAQVNESELSGDTLKTGFPFQSRDPRAVPPRFPSNAWQCQGMTSTQILNAAEICPQFEICPQR